MGIMGTGHAQNLIQGKVPNMEFTAACESDPAALAKTLDTFPGIKGFDSVDELIASGSCDAILIATPHYDHPPVAIAAMKGGLHVCTEKPIAVYTKAAKEMITAAEHTGMVFAIMYNERTNPIYIKAKDLIDAGELGAITRVSWIATEWYRTQHYYDMGSWRGSWAGEGGGILMNQCPHQLDLLQWICGMPESVRAFCRIAQYHDIEVEDDVTAYLTWPNGATGVFIANTAEAPGTNRLEITGTQGRLIAEMDELKFHKLRIDTLTHLKTAKTGFDKPECWEVKVPATGEYTHHPGVLNAFADRILNGGKMIAEGAEGLNGLMLCNAMYLSSWTNAAVSLPIDDEMYWSYLQERIAASAYKG